MTRPIVPAFLAAAVATFAATAAEARPLKPAPSHVAAGRAVDPPAGFVAMCRIRPEQCGPARVDTVGAIAFPALDVAPPAAAVGASTEWLAQSIDAGLAAHGAVLLASAAMPPLALGAVEVAAPAPAAEPVADQPPTLALLRDVNRRVNGGVRQRSDQETTGRSEVWRPSGVGAQAVGDCEDIALEKRTRLIDAGFPADRLALAIVYSRASGLHTILVASTEDGDVVLDSRRSSVVRWHRAKYRWLAIQSREMPSAWHEALVG